MTEVYLNGSFMRAEDARISPMDRGFLFADGVYEVIPAFAGVLFRPDPHLQRLERSLQALDMTNPYAASAWRALCEQIVQRNGGGDLAVYLQVTRGAPARRDHTFPVPPVEPTVFMTAAPLAPTSIDDPDTVPGESAIVVPDLRWGRCDIKSVALLPNVLARQQASAAGAAEAILVRDGFLTEGSSTNVFIVRQGRIATPPLSPRILGGITRELVIELCRTHGLFIEEREVAAQALQDADEIWVTSSSRDVMPIVRLDDRPVGVGRPGPVWRTLAGHYRAFKLAACAG